MKHKTKTDDLQTCKKCGNKFYHYKLTTLCDECVPKREIK